MGKGGKSGATIGEGENRAAWLLGINNLKIQPFKLPALGPKDVKIIMKTVGICGSDVHYLKHFGCGDYVVKEPMVIGHECAGIIDEVGADVKHLVPGDRVALESGISCWQMQPLQRRPAEVNFLGQFDHSNVVRLLGYCLEDQNHLLVYEFMVKGSFYTRLFSKKLFEPFTMG